ncbi:SH3 domain-containing protein [Zopfochytrium polystomum]|nr:SH3 domain-containing protein [Zopfochytrium polystomum]
MVSLVAPLVSPTKGSQDQYALCLWDYTAMEDNEISFKAGNRILVLDLCNEDWYEGRIGAKVVFFPADRVELLSISTPLPLRALYRRPPPPPPPPTTRPCSSLHRLPHSFPLSARTAVSTKTKTWRRQPTAARIL